MRRIIVFPAVFIGCLVVIWVGTVAASNMPSQEVLVPTLTAAAKTASQELESNHSEEDSSPEPAEDHAGCSLSPAYPETILQWCTMIEVSSEETGLPSNLIAALILQESGGDPKILSSSGAVGLMQVMPRDGVAADFMCVNGPCFASRPTIEELKDPAYNIAFGSQMLAGLYAKHGTYRDALYRYGPMDVGYYYADLVLKIWEEYT
jgi:soluble lytic murein transglycosylase-like protein